MTRTIATEFLKVFRFALRLTDLEGKPRDLGLTLAHWEGPHLVFTRGISKDPPRASLAAELAEVDEIVVVLFDAKGDEAHAWRIEHEGVRNRGFLWMDAAEDEVAREAVCLVNARAVHTMAKAVIA